MFIPYRQNSLSLIGFSAINNEMHTHTHTHTHTSTHTHPHSMKPKVYADTPNEVQVREINQINFYYNNIIMTPPLRG